MFNLNDAINFAIASITKKGGNHIDRGIQTWGSCAYSYRNPNGDGTYIPGCIIGTALNEVYGIKPSTMHLNLEDSNASEAVSISLWDDADSAHHMTVAAVDFLNFLQLNQDEGMTWFEAFNDARDKVIVY
jgi:hypothetical protein